MEKFEEALELSGEAQVEQVCSEDKKLNEYYSGRYQAGWVLFRKI